MASNPPFTPGTDPVGSSDSLADDIGTIAPSVIDTPGGALDDGASAFATETSSFDDDFGATAQPVGIKAKAGEAIGAVKQEALSLRGQATDKARQFAIDGKERATGALDDVVRMITDAADTVDDKVGAQYGDYARRAAETVSGFADTLRERDVDDLFEEANAFVRRSPAVAIGIAATLGFALARLVKAGGPIGTSYDADRY